jgi:chitosanase
MSTPFNSQTIGFIRRILSVAETGKPEWDPSAVYIYADDNRFSPARKQITLSIGFTEGGGNLKRVLERYIVKGGALAGAFATYLPSLGSKNQPSRAGDSKFTALLKDAGKEPVMRQAQTECFDEFYLEPAFVWAAANGFTLPLSHLTIGDSFLHSGSMLPKLLNSFREPRPNKGGNEKIWIRDYLRARHDWLKGHSNRLLNNTVYRVNCYLEQLARNNWLLADSPVVMHGTPVNRLA